MKSFILLATLIAQQSYALTIECSWRGNRYDAISQTRGLDTCFQEIVKGSVCYTGNIEEAYAFLSQELQPRAYELSRLGQLMYYPLVTDYRMNVEAQTLSYHVDQAGYQTDVTIGRCQSL